MREKSAMVLHTYIAFLVIVIFITCIVLSFFNEQYVVAFVFILIGFILSTGISVVEPNEAVVIKFIGRYVGSVREVGLFMTLPFTQKNKVSLKVQTLNEYEVKIENEKQTIKLNPIIVYRIVDSAKVIFEVDDYFRFIDTQVELAINSLMDDGAFDGFDHTTNDTETSIVVVQNQLAMNMQKRLEMVGIELIEIQMLT